MIKNMSIAKKLALGFTFILVLMTGLGAYSLFQLQKLETDAREISMNWMPSAIKSSVMSNTIATFRIQEVQHIIANDPQEVATHGKNLEALQEKMGTYFKEYDALISGDEERKFFDASKKDWDEYLDIHKDIAVLASKNMDKEALALFGDKSKKAFDETVDSFKKLVEFNMSGASKLAEEGEASYKSTRLWLISVLAFASVFGGLIAFFLIKSITGPVLAAIERLKSGSEVVASASSQISAAGAELAAAATEQAAALQETVSSVDEVNAMVSKNAENAKRSQEVSLSCKDTTSKGKDAVEQMIRSIGEINQSNTDIMQQVETSNREISDIVNVITEIGNKTKVINDIVFQTKLLSFNASVEAARAGEHGKGFAVVAEEVGNLAQMSGNAAKEISQMLEGSTKKVQQIVEDTKHKVEQLVSIGKQKVEAGSHTAKRCGEILDEIVNNVKEVTHMVSEISTASQEQSQGVQEITKAMAQLDQVTQQNATASQQAASSAESLTTQAADLSSVVQSLVNTVHGGGHVGNLPSSAGAHRPSKEGATPPPANVIAMKKSGGKKKKTAVTDQALGEVLGHARSNGHTNGNGHYKVAAGQTSMPSGDDSRFEDV